MIVRSGKRFRPIAEFARTWLFNGHRQHNANFIRFSRVLSTTLTPQFTSTFHRPNKYLNQSINKLDHEVRKVGRLRRSDVEDVLADIRLIESASSSQSLLLIRCCGNLISEELPEIRTALVQNVWQTLVNLNVPLGVSHYNALLRVYLENEHSYSPTEFLAEMESKSVEPNRVTYERLISKYCQQGDLVGATNMLELMRSKQFPVDEHIFNALILGYSEADDIDSAVGILSAMKEAGLEPTSDTYTQLLCAWAKHGKLDEILPTLDKCKANEIHLLDTDLFEIIYKLATNGRSDFIDNIIPHLQQSSGYNRNAANLILRLVNKCQDDVAFKILLTMPRGTSRSGELTNAGEFFIRQLIKSERPAEKIISFCRDFQRRGLHSRATIFAVEVAAGSGNLDIAVPLFRELKENELPVRQHYFWPLICARRKIGTDAVLDVLRVMQSEFGMTVTSETVCDYVVPSLQIHSYENIVSILQAAGISASIAVRNCIQHALTHDRIKDAATLASNFNIYYEPSLVRRPLVASLQATNDYRSWVSIVRSVYENLPRLQLVRKVGSEHDEEQDDNEIQQQSEVVGQFVVDVVIYSRENKAEATQKVLSSLVGEGLSMSKHHAETVQERLGSLVTQEILTLLDKITSGKLEPVPYESLTTKSANAHRSTQNLEEFIQRTEAEGGAINGLQNVLLQAHIVANDVQKTEQLIEKISKSGDVLTLGLYAQIIELYCSSNNLDKALAVHAEIKSKEPDFVLDDLKTMKLVRELVANDRIDEAVDLLNSNKRADKLNTKPSFGIDALCWRILNLLAEKGRDADVNKVFNALEENNFIQVSNVLLGPLIKVHLVNSDIAKAMTSFESISTTYNCTPWKNELSCKLIEAEDVTNLRLLTNLSTNIHGEVNTLHDLVFSFVQCGRIGEAREILETPVLQGRSERFTEVCARYHREGKTGTLQALLQATKNLHGIDRREIFYNLLLSYCKEDSAEKALNLWTKIQEDDDVAPSDKFLSTLARFLREKSVKVPFVEPVNESTNQDSGRSIKTPTKAGDLNEATERLDPNTKLKLIKETKKLERLINKDQLDNATQHIMKMLEDGTYPLPRIFQFYLTKMSRVGNYVTLEQLATRLTPEIRRKVSFDNKLGSAYLSAGKSVKFFDKIIKYYNGATTDEALNDAENNFPTIAMLSILDKHPELYSKFEKFAENAAQKGLRAPINIMWINHIENGQLDRADRIMRNYLRTSPYLFFGHIVRVARDRKDETIALNLLKALTDTKRYDEAMKAVHNAVNNVSSENINRTAMLRVKDALEAAGKTFPYEITDKKKKADDSSSNSDNDETRN